MGKEFWSPVSGPATACGAVENVDVSVGEFWLGCDLEPVVSGQVHDGSGRVLLFEEILQSVPAVCVDLWIGFWFGAGVDFGKEGSESPRAPGLDDFILAVERKGGHGPDTFAEAGR